MRDLKLNFVEAVAATVKEGEDKAVDTAKKNAPILRAKTRAKITALEAKEEEAEIDLQEAEEGVRRAYATNTRDLDKWVRVVKEAEGEYNTVDSRLKDIQESMNWFISKQSVFDIKKPAQPKPKAKTSAK